MEEEEEEEEEEKGLFKANAVVEEEEEEFIRIHGYYRGTQGARCYTDGASLQPDESEGCSPVSVVLSPALPYSVLADAVACRDRWVS